MTTQRLERSYPTTAQRIWTLWTTPDGIARWWAPDGFETTVDTLELVVGGELVYTMTATDPETVAFMSQNGMPTSTVSRKRFTLVDEPHSIAYASLVDFVPGHDPYEFATDVRIEQLQGETRVIMTMEALHDDVWTTRLLEGRRNELENLARLVTG